MNKFYPYLALLVLLASGLYGVSYQQFRHFDFNDPRGLSDTREYIEVMQGDYESTVLARHRFIIPMLARKARAVFPAAAGGDTDGIALAFYAVNFIIMLATVFVFHLTLGTMGFAWMNRCLGACLFLASRVTVFSSAVPMVDSLYFFGISLLTFLIVSGQLRWLPYLNPLLLLCKEVMLPFLFVPLLERRFRNRAMFISLAACGALLWLLARYAASLGSAQAPHHSLFTEAWQGLLNNHISPGRLLSPSTWHGALYPFSGLLILAALGYRIHRRAPRYNIPACLHAFIPICLFYTFCLTKGAGRNLFPLFVLVIPYALICIENLAPASSTQETHPHAR
jgi:hypothetical protein